MMKCPFCQYDNEEGALFCEQCKSDLGGVQPVAMAAAVEVPMAAAVADDPFPLEEVAEAVPVEEELFAQTESVEAFPAVAAPVEATIPLDPFAEAVPLEEDVPVALAEEAPPEKVVPMAAAPVAEAPPSSATIPDAAPVDFPPPTEATVPLPAAGLEPESTIPQAPFAAAPAPPAPADGDGGKLPAGAQPRLVVLRGQKINAEYPIYEGHNFIGRADEKPVDIDLEDQEPPDRIWSSRQHAFITFEDGKLVIEDLNSSNGTFVNRTRIYPGQKRPLNINDVIQIGTVQMKVKA